MGLDMYLYKSKKVEGFTTKEYKKVADYVEEHVNEKEDILSLDLEKATGIMGANTLQNAIKKCGEHFTWYSTLERIGYWRKANQIHAWFVDHVQGGVDECQLSMVSKEQLEELYRAVNKVKENRQKAEELLPTRSGFFFGNTDYNEWYEEDINETIRILENVFQQTDFEQEVIFYRSSW